MHDLRRQKVQAASVEMRGFSAINVAPLLDMRKRWPTVRSGLRRQGASQPQSLRLRSLEDRSDVDAPTSRAQLLWRRRHGG